MQQRHKPGLHDTSSPTPPWLKKAIELALELEGALNPHAEAASTDLAFRLRLARAHTLGVVDMLTELVIQTSREEPPRSLAG
jgi:hypothetical protein